MREIFNFLKLWKKKKKKKNEIEKFPKFLIFKIFNFGNLKISRRITDIARNIEQN